MELSSVTSVLVELYVRLQRGVNQFADTLAKPGLYRHRLTS